MHHHPRPWRLKTTSPKARGVRVNSQLTIGAWPSLQFWAIRSALIRQSIVCRHRIGPRVAICLVTPHIPCNCPQDINETILRSRPLHLTFLIAVKPRLGQGTSSPTLIMGLIMDFLISMNMKHV